MKQLPSRTAKAKELLTGKKSKPKVKEIKPYVKDGWTLYTKLVRLHADTEQRIYFFSKRPVNSGTPCTKPEGFGVAIAKRSGLPYMKRI